MITPRPVFLRGKVVLPDGVAPMDSIIIERICGGKRSLEAYADSTGNFSFEAGRNSELIPDLSNPRMSMASKDGSFDGWASEHPLAGCELRAVLPGYNSTVVDLSMRQPLHDPDVGTIFLRRIAAVEGSTISVTSLQAPKDAKKSYEKGVKAAQEKKWGDALANFEKAVALYPSYAAAWYELGRVQARLGNVAEARKSYGRSLAADSRFLKPYLAVAALAMKEKDWKEAAETTARLIKLDPIDYPGAYYYNSFAQIGMSNFDAAEKSARAGIGIDPAHSVPDLEHLLGVILANKGDYAGAAALFSSYLEHAPNAADAEIVRKKLAEAEMAARANPLR